MIQVINHKPNDIASIPDVQYYTDDFENQPSVLVYDYRFSEIKNEIEGLKQLVSSLASKIDQIHQSVCDPEYIELRDITYEQAKQEIELFFIEHHGETYYPPDFMKLLGIDFDTAMQVCNELELEGKIR